MSALSFFRRTSRASSFNVASYHRANSITWRWILSVDFKGRIPGWWPLKIVRAHIRREEYGEAVLGLGPTVWRFQWQPHMARP